MAAIIHRARWNFNVDEADGVSRRDRQGRDRAREVALADLCRLDLTV
jgi:hypothetical protein